MSEEEGTISLVREGKITRDVDAGDVAHHAAAAPGGVGDAAARTAHRPPHAARRCAQPQGPTPPWWRCSTARPRDLREALRRNRGLKIVSLLLAFFLWFFDQRRASATPSASLEFPIVVRKLPPT